MAALARRSNALLVDLSAMIRVVLLLVVACVASARADGMRAHAVRRTGPIAIDGRLDEAAWAKAPQQTGFTQRFPKDGAKPDHETHFAILYDNEAIYVGVWADDSDPALVRRLLTRRDVDAPADVIAIGFDSYHDRRTAYVFQLNAAGVQRDMILFDDANLDDTWDAVWTGDAALTATGWTAEFRIPLSQLRYTTGAAHEWGFQVSRTVGRTQEQSTWSPWPRASPQIVSKFGVVDGIDDLVPSRRLELLPYASTGFDHQPVDAGDPINQHWKWLHGIGLDLKYGLGSAFTLSATINPDFGQVEADPSLINLSPNEPFFAEKRPFFLEGVDLFKLPIGNSDGTIEGAFYSRRIGAVPDTSNLDYLYLKQPEAATIFGAAKLTGKTASGWSVGVFDAVTGSEAAEYVDETGATQDPLVAPLTNYAVGRVKRDFRDGRTSIGASVTAVDRALDGTVLAETMHDQAYTAGTQLSHRWDDSAWQLDIHTVGSWVHGTADAIATTQEDNVHLFQRADARDVHLDPTRTSLGGYGLTWNVGRSGNTKHWRFNFGGDLRTPGLELNDLGYQRNSDRIIPYIWGQYREDAPSEHVLNWQVNADVFTVSNFEPQLQAYGIEYNGGLTLENYWSIGGGGNVQRSLWDPIAMRGGPALRQDPNEFYYAYLNTDTRKPLWFSLNLSANRNPTQDMTAAEIDVGATIQARSNIDIYLGPTFATRQDPMQYVDQEPDQAGTMHYIFGAIRQTTTSMTMRVNWTFSPHLTLQAYAQPFIASGRYDQLKDVDNPHADAFADRFHILQGNEYAISDGVVSVHRNGDAYSFVQPDFDFRQVRSTIVLRWEYRPGSTIFAIWNHGRTSETDYDGRFMLGHDLRSLLDAASENLVMIKANYWFGF